MMADDGAMTPHSESFELFEEGFVFEDNDHFLHHKYNHECKKATASFFQILEQKLSPQSGKLCLHQRPDEPINARIIRSVAISCGSNVISVCFTSMTMADKMVEGILPHLSKLQYLQFNGVNIGSVAARAISMFCRNTLKSLRVSECHLITSESCGWLAGGIGHNSPRLRRLKSLDVSFTKVDDRGMDFLSKGLGQLECLDLGNCTLLTGKGMQESLRRESFGSMLVLNLRGCINIGDAGVVAIAKVMSKLKHMNLSRCGNITNKSASAIGQGCAQLITLSLEGALATTDAGLGMIANYTKLNLLNITGCSISRKSLMAVVSTLGYVQESSSFFGFIVRDSDAKVAALNKEETTNTREQQNHAAHIIQGGWRHTIHQIQSVQSAHECHERKAAMKIQSFVLNCRSHKRFNELGYIRTAKSNASIIQKRIRGWLARRKKLTLISMFRTMTHYATIIQARYRGKFVRAHDRLIGPAVIALRAARHHDQRAIAVTVIQCLWRKFMAVSKLKWLRRNFISRRYSFTLIQRIGRSMLARRRSKRFRMCSELHCFYCNKMTIRIQCALRQYFARRELDKCLEFASERYLISHKSARQIQSHFRGGLARRRVNRKRLECNNAAVEIQRIFRGQIVQRWQEMKTDATRKYVHEKADFELNAVKIRRGIQSSKEIETKHCNDELDEAPLKGTPGGEELLKYVFGTTYTHLRCQIYWPEIGLYKSGFIGGYNDRMRLWKINYDKDDSEWLDLVREQDRVLVMEENGIDWIPYTYCRPLPMMQYLEKRRTVEPSNSTWTPHESSEQISSEIWYLVYVSRGALDECYYTQSHESLEKLRSAHLVKSLTISIAKVKYMQRNANNEEYGYNEMQQFERLLSELEEFVQSNLAVKGGCS